MLYGVKFMRERKVFKKIDASKIKDVDGFIGPLKNIVKNNCYSKVKLYYK